MSGEEDLVLAKFCKAAVRSSIDFGALGRSSDMAGLVERGLEAGSGLAIMVTVIYLRAFNSTGSNWGC